ncbi:Ig-like domain-containing protein [Candidatus Berkelbacteria bacterium]|nr:Ig-like domain-containing protein [Candidatus Berkelbacteria bacterium]
MLPHPLSHRQLWIGLTVLTPLMVGLIALVFAIRSGLVVPSADILGEETSHITYAFPAETPADGSEEVFNLKQVGTSTCLGSRPPHWISRAQAQEESCGLTYRLGMVSEFPEFFQSYQELSNAPATLPAGENFLPVGGFFSDIVDGAAVTHDAQVFAGWLSFHPVNQVVPSGTALTYQFFPLDGDEFCASCWTTEYGQTDPRTLLYPVDLGLDDIDFIPFTDDLNLAALPALAGASRIGFVVWFYSEGDATPELEAVRFDGAAQALPADALVGVTVIDSEPTDNATVAVVRPTMTITLDGPVSAAAIQSFFLFGCETGKTCASGIRTGPISVTRLYDEERNTVRITPQADLEAGRRYNLVGNGYEDATLALAPFWTEFTVQAAQAVPSIIQVPTIKKSAIEENAAAAAASVAAQTITTQGTAPAPSVTPSALPSVVSSSVSLQTRSPSPTETPSPTASVSTAQFPAASVSVSPSSVAAASASPTLAASSPPEPTPTVPSLTPTPAPASTPTAVAERDRAEYVLGIRKWAGLGLIGLGILLGLMVLSWVMSHRNPGPPR